MFTGRPLSVSVADGLPQGCPGGVPERQAVGLQVVAHALALRQVLPHRPVEVEEVGAGRLVDGERELDADEAFGHPEAVHRVAGREEPGVGAVVAQSDAAQRYQRHPDLARHGRHRAAAVVRARSVGDL